MDICIYMIANGRKAIESKINKKTINLFKSLTNVKKELAALKKKHGHQDIRKVKDTKRGLSDVKFCNWCKRAERNGYNPHDSDECFHKCPTLRRPKKGRK